MSDPNGLRWRDASAAYGPSKTIYSRFIRWSRMGVFNRIFAALAAKGGKPDQLMINATHLKAHRTAASLIKKMLFPADDGSHDQNAISADRNRRNETCWPFPRRCFPTQDVVAHNPASIQVALRPRRCTVAVASTRPESGAIMASYAERSGGKFSPTS